MGQTAAFNANGLTKSELPLIAASDGSRGGRQHLGDDSAPAVETVEGPLKCELKCCGDFTLGGQRQFLGNCIDHVVDYLCTYIFTCE